MEEDLPRAPHLRDRIILAIFGSPDIRQIDGLGGADSLTSKLALIAPSKESDRDIDYTFGAVGIDKAFAITAGISTAAAAVITGSIVQEVIGSTQSGTLVKKVTIGHPSGKFEVEVEARQEGGQLHIHRCTVGRTARKIMEGRVYIPRSIYSSVR